MLAYKLYWFINSYLLSNLQFKIEFKTTILEYFRQILFILIEII